MKLSVLQFLQKNTVLKMVHKYKFYKENINHESVLQ